MALAFILLLSMLGIPLLVLVVLVDFIRRRRFGLKRLLILAALFGLLMLPLVEFKRRYEQVPQPLSFDGENRWVTPPLAGAEYWISLVYRRDKPGRLGGTLMLRLFDESDGTLVPSTASSHLTTQIFGNDEVRGVCHFRATVGHRYRIEADEDQAAELARYKHPWLWVRSNPAQGLGMP